LKASKKICIENKVYMLLYMLQSGKKKRGIAMSIVKHKYGDATSSVSGTRQNSMRWRVNQMPTSTGDIPAADDEQWSDAARGKFYRPLKTQARVLMPIMSGKTARG
jgi:hypothetical protein